MKTLILLITALMLSGCHSISSFSKGDILHETPFTSVVMNGPPAESALCVSKYWQSQIGTGTVSDDWQVWTYPNEVEISRPIHMAPHPLITAVIMFDGDGSKTTATVYCHAIASSQEALERTITLKALEACKGQEPEKAVEAVKPEPKLIQPTITKKPKYQEIINQ